MVDETTRKSDGSSGVESEGPDTLETEEDELEFDNPDEVTTGDDLEFGDSGEGATESSPTTSASMGTTTQDSQSQQPQQQSQDSTAVGTNKGNMKFCEHCGSEISMEAELCPSCGVRLESNEKSPGVAALLSAVINGGGQIYNGDVVKGIAIMGVQVINVILIFFLIGFLTFPLVWIYSVYDAYKTAQTR
ncbi:zinc ribbon domain-containing protein [Natronococcus roseus]|uniref:hypothetical protein n=1 Tax=Natronococcus roseus TaxID=1052014 RepID=UPI00374C96F4